MNGALVYRCFVLLVLGVCGVAFWVDYTRIPELGDSVADIPIVSDDSVAVAANGFQLLDMVEMADVTKRPLFSLGRGSQTASEDSPDQKIITDKKEPPFTVVVTGIVYDGTDYMAVLRDTKTKKEHTLYLDDALPDDYKQWRLKKVEADQVVVKKQTKTNNESNNENKLEWTTKRLRMAEGTYYTRDGSSP